MQVSPQLYPTFRQGLWLIYQAEGVAGLYRGLIPTMLAYGTQTGVKYGMYEVFKGQLLRQMMLMEDDTHEPLSSIREKYKSLVYLVSAAGAEAIANVLMCPWEMLKVRTQTDRTFPKDFWSGLRVMRSEPSFPFGSLGPLLGRQVPTTMVNFVLFENVVAYLHRDVLHRPKQDCDMTTQLSVTLVGGYTAGLVATVCTHVPDSLLSLQSRPEFASLTYRGLIQRVGLWYLCTNGLGPRVAMTGTILAGQWLLYDTFRTCVGLGTIGGASDS